MNEQAKTVKELAGRIGWCACGPGTEEGTPERQANVEGAVLSVMRGSHLIPGADAVVTEEGLEAASEAAYNDETQRERFARSWEEVSEEIREAFRRMTRAALEAAGIVIAERVVKGYLTEVDGMVFVTDGQRDTTSLGSLSGTTISIAVLPEKGK